MYPCAGKVQRIFGLANDCVSCNGQRICITAENHVPAEKVEFAKGIAIYDTIQPISNFSVTKTQRVLLPLVIGKIRKRALK